MSQYVKYVHLVRKLKNILSLKYEAPNKVSDDETLLNSVGIYLICLAVFLSNIWI